MKVKREIASLPTRSARETWDTIVKLISGPGSIDCDQLNTGASIMASAIADEHAAQSPIVVKGVGSRLVIYTVHGADAMELGLGVDSLNWNPTGGDSAPRRAGPQRTLRRARSRLGRVVNDRRRPRRPPRADR